MTKSTDQRGIQPIEGEILKPDSKLETDSSSKNSAQNSKPSKFPCSKLEASKHLPISDPTVGKWLTELTNAGVRDDGGKVSASDFHHLTQMCEYKAQGKSSMDYVGLMKQSTTDEPETVDAELLDSPLTTQDDGSQYAMVVSKQQNAVAVQGARLDLENQRLMESLQTIAKAKREKDALQTDVSTNKRKKWQAEVLADLSEEYAYKAALEAEMREKLGL